MTSFKAALKTIKTTEKRGLGVEVHAVYNKTTTA